MGGQRSLSGALDELSPRSHLCWPLYSSHLEPRHLGMKVHGWRRKVYGTTLSLFQVKQPNLLWDAKLTLG